MENRVSFQLPVLLISPYHYLFMLCIDCLYKKYTVCRYN